MSLHAMQRDMRAWLTTGSDEAAERIGSTAAPGLRIYQNNYRASLTACLEDCFARTRAWIGGDAFHDAAIVHIDQVPPSSWTLDAYPRDFPATLTILYPDDPEVSELAWMDNALADAFVGPDMPAIMASALAGIDWDSAVLHFTPTLELADLRTNAPAIWSALDAENVPPAVEILPEPGAILVWRQDYVSCFRAIDRAERDALLMVRSGMPFATLCSTVAATHGEGQGVALAGSWLGRWIADGLLSQVSTT